VSEKTNARFHPLANAFPLITGEEFDDLVDDIRKNGLLSPVVMYEGKILDGRNRWSACQSLGIPHTEKTFTGQDPAAYVWSANAVRRQLTASQRAIAAAKLADLAKGSNQHAVKLAPGGSDAQDRVPVTSIGDAAKMAGVGRRTVDEAKRVLENAVDGVVEAVESGELSVHAAERVSRLPREEQRDLLETTPLKEIPRAVPARPRMEIVDPDDDTDVRALEAEDPELVMATQMEQISTREMKALAETWASHVSVIAKLDQKKLDAFVRKLRANRRNIDHLVKLIELTRKQATKGS
jgi:ParB-like chromosome segregation protein Spo0J